MNSTHCLGVMFCKVPINFYFFIFEAWFLLGLWKIYEGSPNSYLMSPMGLLDFELISKTDYYLYQAFLLNSKNCILLRVQPKYARAEQYTFARSSTYVIRVQYYFNISTIRGLLIVADQYSGHFRFTNQSITDENNFMKWNIIWMNMRCGKAWYK